MKIEKTSFGSITIDGVKYSHDIYINIDGTITKRRKDLSKSYSKVHTVLGPDEIKLLLQQKPKTIVIGKGQTGILPIPEESRKLLKESKVIIIEDKTPIVIHMINDLVKEKAKIVAILHLTC
ncbi:MAG: MTH938/NDUFAF3 family protein [Candidatus Thorarchaeota archaeon]